ncbi:dCTP deaminase [Pseudomonas serbica]|jgi:deoxycytidine triphosphate deaminase
MIQSPMSLLELIREGKLIKNLSARELQNPEGVGFDLQLANLSRIGSGSGSLRSTTRRTPDSEFLSADNDGCFRMEPGRSYLATTIEEFDLPEGMVALFYPRSTLFRSGISFSSSVLPPGYIGPMTFALTNHHIEAFEIEIGARFAHAVIQLVSGDIGLYRGQWQGGRISQSTDEGQV